MNIEAVGLTQRTKLGGKGPVGEVESFLNLRLPDGSIIEVKVAEADVKKLLIATSKQSAQSTSPARDPEVKLGVSTAPLWQPPEPSQHVPQTLEERSSELSYDNDEGGFVFGGVGSMAEEPRPDMRQDVPMIAWAQLPDDLLPQLMKAALVQVNTPALMAGDHLQQRVAHIQETYTEEDWNMLAQMLVEAQHGLSGDVVEPSAVEVMPTPSPLEEMNQNYDDAMALLQERMASAQTPKKPKRAPAPPLGQVQWANGAPIIAQARPPRTIPKDDYGMPVVAGQVRVAQVVGDGDVDDLGVGQA